MTAKEYLSQARRINTRIKAMAEQLEYLKAATEHTGTRYSDMPKPANRNIRKNEDAMIKVVDLERRINDQFNRLADISATIESVSDPILQTLLVKRYLKCEPWQEISCEMHFSPCHIYRLHNTALDEVEIVISNGSKV